VLLLLAIAGAIATQAQTALERLEVVLWPEYDRPSVLVMLRGYLPMDAPLPTTVVLPIPATSTPHAVAKRDPAVGNLLMAAHTVEGDGPWSRVRIVADMLEVRLEYYTDLPATEAQRQILFEWPGGLEIGQLVYEIMQPVGADGLVVTPPGLQRIGPDGLTYHVGDLGPIGAGEAFSIAVSYTKTSPLLTAEALKPPAPAPQMSQPPAQPSTSTAPAAEGQAGAGANTALAVLVVILAAALVGTWVFFGSRKAENQGDDSAGPSS
jgi:hypothetical protein